MYLQQMPNPYDTYAEPFSANQAAYGAPFNFPQGPHSNRSSPTQERQSFVGAAPWQSIQHQESRRSLSAGPSRLPSFQERSQSFTGPDRSASRSSGGSRPNSALSRRRGSRSPTLPQQVMLDQRSVGQHGAFYNQQPYQRPRSVSELPAPSMRRKQRSAPRTPDPELLARIETYRKTGCSPPLSRRPSQSSPTDPYARSASAATPPIMPPLPRSVTTEDPRHRYVPERQPVVTPPVEHSPVLRNVSQKAYTGPSWSEQASETSHSGSSRSVRDRSLSLHRPSTAVGPLHETVVEEGESARRSPRTGSSQPLFTNDVKHSMPVSDPNGMNFDFGGFGELDMRLTQSVDSAPTPKLGLPQNEMQMLPRDEPVPRPMPSSGATMSTRELQALARSGVLTSSYESDTPSVPSKSSTDTAEQTKEKLRHSSSADLSRLAREPRRPSGFLARTLRPASALFGQSKSERSVSRPLVQEPPGIDAKELVRSSSELAPQSQRDTAAESRPEKAEGTQWDRTEPQYVGLEMPAVERPKAIERPPVIDLRLPSEYVLPPLFSDDQGGMFGSIGGSSHLAAPLQPVDYRDPRQFVEQRHDSAYESPGFADAKDEPDHYPTASPLLDSNGESQQEETVDAPHTHKDSKGHGKKTKKGKKRGRKKGGSKKKGGSDAEDSDASGEKALAWDSENEEPLVDSRKPAGKLFGRSLMDVADEKQQQRLASRRFYGQLDLQEDDDRPALGDEKSIAAPSSIGARSFRDNPLGTNDTRERMEAIFGVDATWAREMQQKREREAVERVDIAFLASQAGVPPGLLAEEQRSKAASSVSSSRNSNTASEARLAAPASGEDDLYVPHSASQATQPAFTPLEAPRLDLPLMSSPKPKAASRDDKWYMSSSDTSDSESERQDDPKVPSEAATDPNGASSEPAALAQTQDDSDEDVPLARLKQGGASAPAVKASGAISQPSLPASDSEEDMPLATVKRKALAGRRLQVMPPAALNATAMMAQTPPDAGDSSEEDVPLAKLRSRSKPTLSPVVPQSLHLPEVPKMVSSSAIAKTSDDDDDRPVGMRHGAAQAVAMAVQAQKAKQLQNAKVSAAVGDRKSAPESDDEDDRPLQINAATAALLAQKMAAMRVNPRNAAQIVEPSLQQSHERPIADVAVMDSPWLGGPSGGPFAPTAEKALHPDKAGAEMDAADTLPTPSTSQPMVSKIHEWRNSIPDGSELQDAGVPRVEDAYVRGS